MKVSHEIRSGICYSLYLTLVICVLSPLAIISSHPKDFYIESIMFLGNLIGISSAFFVLILSPISLVFIFSKKNVWHRRIVFSLVVMVTVFALYLPLGYGKLDGVDEINISRINLVLGISLTVFSYFLYSFRKIVLPILIIGPVVTSSLSILNQFNLSNNQVLPVSKTEKNIFVFSFDALQTEYVKSAIDSLPDQKKAEFEGFTLFTDVLGVGPATSISTAMTKLGRIVEDDEYQEAFTDQITTKLSEKGYGVETFHDFSYNETIYTNKLSPTIGQGDSYYFAALKAAILRIIPYENDYLNLFEFYFNGENYQQISLDKHPLAYFKKQVSTIDEVIDGLDTGGTKPTLRMHHYYFTHDPFRLTSECKYIGANKSTTPLSETKCAIGKMVQLLQKIKELGVYQNSLIFFTSDHGYECRLEQKDAFHINNRRASRRWCLTRYTPFMMVKPLFEMGQLKESRMPVSLFDIAKTICMASLNDQKECSIYQGYDLFSSTPPSNSHFRPLLISKTEEDKRAYQDFNKVKIPRYMSINEYYKIQNNTIEYLGANLPSQFSDAAIKKDGKISISGTGKGFLTYGPYISLRPGAYKVSVNYRYKNIIQNQADSVSSWDVIALNGKLRLYRNAFTSSPSQYTLDETYIFLREPTNNVEIRTFFGGSGELAVDKIKISRLPHQPMCSETLKFNEDASASYYSFSNLSLKEAWGRWSDGGQAEIKFQTDPDCNAKSVTFNLKAFFSPKNPEQTASVFINGKSVGDIQISSGEAQPKQFTFALPDTQNYQYTIRFEIDKPTTPKSVGVNSDTRELGIGFIDMRLLSDEVTIQ